MFEQFFENYWWPGPLLWIAVYISDYMATVISARLYRRQAKDHLVFDGSFELTPQFQKDIDSLRWVSPRFLIMLVLTSLILIAEWWLSRQEPFGPGMYMFILGGFILMEAAVHMRHFRNLFLFRTHSGRPALQAESSIPEKLYCGSPLLSFSNFPFFTFYYTLPRKAGSCLEVPWLV